MSERATILPDSLVSTGWLAEHLNDPGLRVVDIRGYVKTTDLGEGRQHADYVGAGDEYATSHLPGAVFVDWTSDIVDADNPVKSQIAPPEVFAAEMGAGMAAMLGLAAMAPAAPVSAQSCHPSYGGCLPVVYDLDCWEIGYAVVEVWNVWDDPYGLDDYSGPGNGWTCDSY